jgi:hypothetical protein
MALDGLLTAIKAKMNRRLGAALTWIIILFLAGFSIFQNYDLVFNQYAANISASAWNTTELGSVIKQFGQVYGTTDSVWIVAYPYWVDTRLPGDAIGIPNRDFAIWPQDFNKTLDIKAPKLFMIKVDDTKDAQALEQLYPQGALSKFYSATKLEGMNFQIFFVPSNK